MSHSLLEESAHYQAYDPGRYDLDLDEALALGQYDFREIAPHLPSRDAPILEIGCGPGALLTALRERGYSDLRGVDRDAGLAAQGRDRLGIGVAVGEWREHLSACPERYAAIVALDVLEHVPAAEWLPTLRATAARLLPGGRLILRVPNPECPLALPNFHGDITHVAMATPDLLRHLLAEAGFRGPIRQEETRPYTWWKRMVFTAIHRLVVGPAMRLLYFHFYGRAPRLLTRNYYCFAYTGKD